jgi:hypothetical protein
MAQKDKELLLADLCARLPYGVKIHINSTIEEQNSMELFDVNLNSEHIGVGNEKWTFRAIPIIDDEDKAKVVKPYLRPLSSMTEEENKEAKENGCIIYCDTSPEDKGLLVFASQKGFDWLNKKMFDYRKDDEGKTMIEKGLALEAPKGMYN